LAGARISRRLQYCSAPFIGSSIRSTDCVLKTRREYFLFGKDAQCWGEMADIVNLRAERKRAKHKRQEAEAAENRALHGRSKAERDAQKAHDNKARRDLDAHLRERGEP
jgi:hypothetical protein